MQKRSTIADELRKIADELSANRETPLGKRGLDEQAFFLQGIADDLAEKIKDAKFKEYLFNKSIRKIISSSVIYKLGNTQNFQIKTIEKIAEHIIERLAEFVVVEVQRLLVEHGVFALSGRTASPAPKEVAELLFCNISGPAGQAAIKELCPSALR